VLPSPRFREFIPKNRAIPCFQRACLPFQILQILRRVCWFVSSFPTTSLTETSAAYGFIEWPNKRVARRQQSDRLTVAANRITRRPSVPKTCSLQLRVPNARGNPLISGGFIFTWLGECVAQMQRTCISGGISGGAPQLIFCADFSVSYRPRTRGQSTTLSRGLRGSSRPQISSHTCRCRREVWQRWSWLGFCSEKWTGS